MKPFDKTKLLKLLDNSWNLEDPEWMDSNTVSFYIPTWFNPDEYFEGLNVSRQDNDDYINIYLYYDIGGGTLGLGFVYFTNSGNDDAPSEFDVIVELERDSYEILLEKIHLGYKELINEWSGPQ